MKAWQVVSAFLVVAALAAFAAALPVSPVWAQEAQDGTAAVQQAQDPFAPIDPAAASEKIQNGFVYLYQIGAKIIIAFAPIMILFCIALLILGALFHLDTVFRGGKIGLICIFVGLFLVYVAPAIPGLIKGFLATMK